MGGITLSRDRVLASRTRKDSAARTLKSVVERITELGVQIKDADTGLIDFPTLYKDREVYLCWRLGETGIGFWHYVEDGFGGGRRSMEFFGTIAARKTPPISPSIVKLGHGCYWPANSLVTYHVNLLIV